MTLHEILDPGTRHDVVLDVLSDALDRHQRSEAEICLSLFRAFRDNLHRAVGINRFEDYVERNWGQKPKLTSVRKFIGSKLAGLPVTLDALESGQLTYTKVREFVNLATPDDEAEWVEFAQTHTNRQIEQKVRRRQSKDGTERTTVTGNLDGKERQAFRQARQVLSEAQGRRIPPSEVVGEMAKAIAGGLFEQAAEEADGKEPEAPAAPKKPPVYVAIQPCPICLDAFTPTPEGLFKTPMADWVRAVRDGAEVFDLTPDYFCDCEGEKHRRDRCSNWSLPDVDAATSRYVPAEVKRIVRARDGAICRNPACRDELPLQGSHLSPYRDGTPAIPAFLREHCGCCNQAIERGTLKVVGVAPYERYYDAHGEFLGYGYDPEPRTEELPGGRSHVGRPPEAPPRARKSGRNGSAGPPNGG